jgi:hypothetical protein
MDEQARVTCLHLIDLEDFRRHRFRMLHALAGIVEAPANYTREKAQDRDRGDEPLSKRLKI